MDARIDVIIPIYNTPADLLEQCICSVLNQTYSNINIIAINDGSIHEDTLNIIGKYSKNKKINVYNIKNSGVSTARNTGLNYSNGEYVFFLDSDDYLDEGYLKRMLDVLRAQRVDLVFSGRIMIPGGISDAPFVNHKIDIAADSDTIAIKQQAFTSNGVLIKGELARSEKFDSGARMGEDTDYILRIMAHSLNGVYFEGKGGCYYVKHASNATNGSRREDIEVFLNYSNVLADRIKEVINPSAEAINVFRLLKFSRASKKMKKAKMSFKIFRTMFEDYVKDVDFGTVKSRRILKNNLLSSGEKIRIILLAKRRLFVLFMINKVLVK